MKPKKTTATRLLKEADDVFRDYIRRRDRFTCQMCKAKNCKLTINHILPKYLFPHLRWEPDNAILFCMECHATGWHCDILGGAQWLQTNRPDLYDKAMANRHARKRKVTCKFISAQIEKLRRPTLSGVRDYFNKDLTRLRRWATI